MKYQSIVKTAILLIGMTGFIACNNSTKKTQENSSDRPEQMQQQRPQQQGRPSVSDLIAQMDSDKDGKLSESEVQGPLKNEFAKIDADKDGFLTKEELEKAPKPEGGQRGEGQH